MRIKLIPPVPIPEDECKKIEKKYKKVLRPDTEVKMVSIGKGPVILESYYNRLLSEFFVLQEGEKTKNEDFDALVLDCMFGPAVKPLREVLDIPVVSPLECSIYVAALLGKKFSVLVLNNSHAEALEEKIRESGLSHWKLASIRSLDISLEKGQYYVYGIKEKILSKKDIEGKVLTVARKAMREDNADVILIGCTALPTIVNLEKVHEELGIPVISPGLVTVRMAELMVDLDLKQSKKAYPTAQSLKAPKR